MSLLLLAGVASADDTGDSAPMEVPAAEPAPAQKTLDDKVGDFLDGAGNVGGKAAAATVDVLVLRTMGVAATGVGFGFFVCSLPLTYSADGVREAWETFVTSPAEYTFQRPLGQF